jgi:transcriptional regulator with XRE-family HTH domain
MAGKKGEAQTVSEQLREQIRKCGLSLEKLGKASGVSAGQISRFLRDERALTTKAVDKLCLALGLKLTKSRRPPGGGAETD